MAGSLLALHTTTVPIMQNYGSMEPWFRHITLEYDWKLATQYSIRMGANRWGYFKGRIAQMQVYNEALTQEQIQAIQQQTEAVGEYVTNQKCLVEACTFRIPNWLFCDVQFL